MGDLERLIKTVQAAPEEARLDMRGVIPWRSQEVTSFDFTHGSASLSGKARGIAIREMSVHARGAAADLAKLLPSLRELRGF